MSNPVDDLISVCKHVREVVGAPIDPGVAMLLERVNSVASCIMKLHMTDSLETAQAMALEIVAPKIWQKE